MSGVRKDVAFLAHCFDLISPLIILAISFVSVVICFICSAEIKLVLRTIYAWVRSISR